MCRALRSGPCFPDSTASGRYKQHIQAGPPHTIQLTKVPGGMRSSFLAGKIKERFGSCGFELVFKGCIGKKTLGCDAVCDTGGKGIPYACLAVFTLTLPPLCCWTGKNRDGEEDSILSWGLLFDFTFPLAIDRTIRRYRE